MFNVNLTSVLTWLLPSFLRGKTIIAMLQSMLTPLQNLHVTLARFRTLKAYELSITPQIIWLEKMLNDKFDVIGAGIYITDVEEIPQVWMSNKSENPHPDHIFNKSEATDIIYVFNRIENTYGFNFTVMVPVIIYQQLLANSGLDSMKAHINKYKLFGTRYIIKSY